MKGKFSFLVLLCLLMVGCGERVAINSGEVGKQITTSGLEKEIREPGSFRMETCFVTACPRLVRLQTAVSAQTVSIDKVFLPKSNVTLNNVTFGIQFRIKNNQAAIDSAFDTIRSIAVSQGNEFDRVITTEMVFDTYIARKAPETVIAAMRMYTIEQSLTEVDTISRYVKGVLNESLKDTPVEVTEFGFPNGIGNPPAIVLEAKERLYAVEERKTQRVRELEAELSVETQRQAVQCKRAENDKMIAEEIGIAPDQYMLIKTLERFADAADKGTPIAVGGAMIPLQGMRKDQ